MKWGVSRQVLITLLPSSSRVVMWSVHLIVSGV